MINENLQNQIDVLCIGDTVVEPFIKLEKAEVHCGIDKVGCTITLPFGAKIPYETATMLYGVGNPANAAVSVSRLGLRSALLCDIGDDEDGQKSLDAWKKDNVVIDYVNIHKGMLTNYHYVLWYPPERTILIKHNTYPRKINESKLSLSNPKYIYLTSLPADAINFQSELVAWLKKNRQIKVLFQPGTFQIKLGVNAQKDLYHMSYVLVVNKEEAQEVLGINENEIQKLLEMTQKLGPQIVCITDGPNGAYLRYQNKNYYMPIYPDIKPPFERTGAGDAFASTFLAALALAKSPLEAITYAPINSMNVVQEIGAQKGLLTMSELETYLRNAPSDYKIVEI